MYDFLSPVIVNISPAFITSKAHLFEYSDGYGCEQDMDVNRIWM